MIRIVELRNHLPNFIKEYHEINKILEVENPYFQKAIDETEKILNNLFIVSSDEKGIERYEKMMGIIPLETDTLESRKSRVLTRWYAALPYTWFFLIRKLNSLCGVNNYDIQLDNDKYTINIKTYLDLSGQIEELLYLFDYLLPANVVYKIFNQINVISEESKLKTGGYVATCNEIVISDENNKINVTSDIKAAIAISYCEEIAIY